MEITQMRDDNDNILATDIWITKKSGLRYVNVEKEEGTCPICKEKHSLKAHHMIPRRLRTDKPLAELRIRICDDCHKKIHPENILILGMRKLVEIVDDLTDGGADKIDVVKECQEFIYNRKYKDGELYNHLDKINENLEKEKCL